MDQTIIDTIKLFIAQIVERANSGHPGSSISLTPLFHFLYPLLRFDPDDDKWCDRDILIMSNGHACLVQYVYLHLMGYITFDDLLNFRVLNSITPGHPENTTPGITVTTGPLGQGLASAVGTGFSQKLLNLSGISIVIFGDGCYMEGISHEAFGLAARYAPRCIFIYDSNDITIDGPTFLSLNEDAKNRFVAYKFVVLESSDASEIGKILKTKINYMRNNEKSEYYKEVQCDKILLVIFKNKICGGTIVEGSEKTHGAPLGKEVIDAFKENNSLAYELYLPEFIYKHYNKINSENRILRKTWNKKMCEESTKGERIFSLFPEFDPLITKKNYYEPYIKNLEQFLDKPAQSGKISTRKAVNNTISILTQHLPFIISGSADLTPSCLTKSNNLQDFITDAAKSFNYKGSYIRFGVREHGMIAMMNGISAHGFFFPIGSTFLNFITYGFPALRIACLSDFKMCLVLTHDSIALGEDGPTHQPIEALSLLRSTPCLTVFRPCDQIETNFSVVYSLKCNNPVVLICSRQDLECVGGTDYNKCNFGAYIVYRPSKQNKDCITTQLNETEIMENTIHRADLKNSKSSHISNIDSIGDIKGMPHGIFRYNSKNKERIILLASGSEVSLAINVAKIIGAEVASFLSFELFDKQDENYKEELLDGIVISIEAGSTFGWCRYAQMCIGIDEFGKSGKGSDVMINFGFTVDAIVEKIGKFLTSYRSLQC